MRVEGPDGGCRKGHRRSTLYTLLSIKNALRITRLVLMKKNRERARERESVSVMVYYDRMSEVCIKVKGKELTDTHWW